MRLTDLDARLIQLQSDGAYLTVDTLGEADGILFQCPKCAVGHESGSRDGRKHVVGAHYVLCWFVGRVPDDIAPKPGRWTPSGTSLNDLTFVPGKPPRQVSVWLSGPGCGWHGHVRDGEATLS